MLGATTVEKALEAEVGAVERVDLRATTLVPKVKKADDVGRRRVMEGGGRCVRRRAS